MQRFLQKIRDLNGQITPQLLREIISSPEHKKDRERMLGLYERYKASVEGVPILHRTLIDYDDFKSDSIRRLDNKVNNMLNNAFDADIVDTKIGYFLGHPITYEYDDGREPGTPSKVKDDIDNFNIRNHVEDEDSELGKMAAICGKSARLAYIEKDTGHERVKNIDPWQVIFLGEDIHAPEYSIRYFKGAENEYHAEFYNDTFIYFFKSKGDKGDFELVEVKEHLFDFNPLFGLENNKEQQGDAEKVLTLIDAYDRTLSDASNEIEQYRLAYLVLKGMTTDDDVDMRYKKVIELLGEHDDVSYLTKDINDALIEHHLNRLEKNILRFAKSVDFTDENFGGDSSGVALKQKLRALENKCITMERKFTAMLRYQYKVLFSAWAKRSSVNKEDYLKVWFGFKRNNPVNLLEEANTTQILQGRVSEKTRLAALSIVDDVEYEIGEMKKEAEQLEEQLEPLSGYGSSNIDNQNTPSIASSGEGEKEEKTCPKCGGTGKVSSDKTGDSITCDKCGGDGVVTR